MKQNIYVLVTERNSHVREFLKRELMEEGFSVQLAENGNEMLKKIYRKEPLDLLILDPDLPDTDVPGILNKINDRIPRLPVVFHTFQADYQQYSDIIRDAVFVEKQGSSVENLKQIIFELLKRKPVETPVKT